MPVPDGGGREGDGCSIGGGVGEQSGSDRGSAVAVVGKVGKESQRGRNGGDNGAPRGLELPAKP